MLPPVLLGVIVMVAPSTFSAVSNCCLSVLIVNVKSKLPLAVCGGALQLAE